MVSCQIFDICLEFEREHIVRGKEQPCLSVSLVRKYVQINLHLSVIFFCVLICPQLGSFLSRPHPSIQHPTSSIIISCWWSANTWQVYGSDICKSPGSATSCYCSCSPLVIPADDPPSSGGDLLLRHLHHHHKHGRRVPRSLVIYLSQWVHNYFSIFP